MPPSPGMTRSRNTPSTGVVSRMSSASVPSSETSAASPRGADRLGDDLRHRGIVVDHQNSHDRLRPEYPGRSTVRQVDDLTPDGQLHHPDRRRQPGEPRRARPHREGGRLPRPHRGEQLGGARHALLRPPAPGGAGGHGPARRGRVRPHSPDAARSHRRGAPGPVRASGHRPCRPHHARGRVGLPRQAGLGHGGPDRRAERPGARSEATGPGELAGVRAEADRFWPDLDLLFRNSERMRAVEDIVRRAADTNATILLQGESGTGKEMVAKAIHHISQRRDRPFLKVNCASLPGRPPRVRAVRPREGCLHRRAPTQAGKVRARASGHLPPRRDRRDAARACRPSCSTSSRTAASSGWAAAR